MYFILSPRNIIFRLCVFVVSGVRRTSGAPRLGGAEGHLRKLLPRQRGLRERLPRPRGAAVEDGRHPDISHRPLSTGTFLVRALGMS